MALSTMINTHSIATADHSRRFSIRAHQEAVLSPHRPQTIKVLPTTAAKKKSQSMNRLAESISSLLHLHIETPPKKPELPRLSLPPATPTISPKERIAEKWREIHGSENWEGLLDPLHPWLRREVVKYGEFAQATYDAFDFDSFSDYCGSSRHNARKLFDKTGLGKSGYKVTKYLYAMSHAANSIPRWLERSHLLDSSWSRDSNWMGYVAVSDDAETERIGRRDVVVAWRGTVAPSEWYEDLQRKMDPLPVPGPGPAGAARAEHGFLSLYTSKSESTRYNRTSASEQVMSEVARLAEAYRARGEEVSLTVTGHSLGGALALLTAHEAAARALPGLDSVSVVSFGAPRVGNGAFRDELSELGVRTLRVVSSQDMVPKMPGLVLSERPGLEWVYSHAGVELRVDAGASPYLKRGLNLAGFHSLETYLHLVDGFEGKMAPFRVGARRDVALVNKSCDMLVDELRVPKFWYQLANKGLVCNDHGRWVKPTRDSDDIPSPIGLVPSLS